MPCYTSLSDFKKFGIIVEELVAKEVETFSIVLYGKMNRRALSYPPPNMAATTQTYTNSQTFEWP